MIILNDISAMKAQSSQWISEDCRIAFVPTMGNLHEGHLTLVREAKKRADTVIASIFVNPTQFDKKEDLNAYPRTMDEDIRLLEQENVDCLFAPESSSIYPDLDSASYITVAGVGEILEGASRKGHFTGVATIVCKLFNIVKPHVAMFGQKDFQQLMLIEKMVADLNMDVDIQGIPTVRETDGLAMSSRNGYLTAEERAIAPTLYKHLSQALDSIRSGRKDYQQLQTEISDRLNESGFRTDYIEVRRRGDLLPANENDENLVILAAAWLGKARLIDNISFRI